MTARPSSRRAGSSAVAHDGWTLREVLVPLHADLVPHLDRLSLGWTHGDGHPSNLLWSGVEVTAVLDLGLADRTTPLVDLATAVERSAVSWLDPRPRARLDLVDALLAGWRSARPGEDLFPLPALLPLVHLELALSELGCFAAVTRSPANGDLAYRYAVGHARWWRGPAGRALRAHLVRACAA